MIYGILLAAGKSTRFGSNKLIHPFQSTSHCIAVETTLNLLSGVDRCIAVIHPSNNLLKAAFIRHNVDIVECEQSEQGMSESIKCGISNTLDADAWIITLADMPYVKTGTIKLMSNLLKEGHQIVAPFYEGKRGNPIGFSRYHKSSLLSLTDDFGAKFFLRAHEKSIYKFHVEDRGILQDIDYPNDIHQAKG